jgi:hypothetical protein
MPRHEQSEGIPVLPPLPGGFPLNVQILNREVIKSIGGYAE